MEFYANAHNFLNILTQLRLHTTENQPSASPQLTGHADVAAPTPHEFGFVEARDVVPGFALTPVVSEPHLHLFVVDGDVEGPALSSFCVADLLSDLEAFSRDVLFNTADVHVVDGTGDALHFQRLAASNVAVLFRFCDEFGHAWEMPLAWLGHVVGVVKQAAWNVSEEEKENVDGGGHNGHTH